MCYGKDRVCCFTGYRPEKIHLDSAGLLRLQQDTRSAVHRAAQAGCRAFLCGMSRGFDLLAAQQVLALQDSLGLELWAAVPFPGQDARWEPYWREAFHDCLLAAGRVFCLSERYTPGCYHARNRFLVASASRMICYFDGQPGGTAYTVRLARAQGLTIDNLADQQLSLL